MRLVRLKKAGDFSAWRAAARSLLQDRIPPDRVDWRCGDEGEMLFGDLAGEWAPEGPSDMVGHR